MPSPWLVYKPQPARRLRLYCFPYAGGSAASFAAWQAALGREIEVCAIQMPGRGARMYEAYDWQWDRLVRDITAVLMREPAVPFAFFGHSLGSLVAFEVARQLKYLRQAQPQIVIVSGCEAPQKRQLLEQYHLLDDAGLIGGLRKLNGTPEHILENQELMALVLPTIRADMKLAAEYQYRPGPRLAQPMAALAGDADVRVRHEAVAAWQLETAADCPVHRFAGDHFFLDSERDAVLAVVRAALLQYATP